MIAIDLLANLPEPTPAAVLAARQTAGHSQTQAAETVGALVRAWQRWEAGDRAVNSSTWALYLLATGQHPALEIRQRR